MESLDSQLLYTEKEACALLAVSRSTLRRAMGDGLLRPVHVGRAIRFTRHELETYVAHLEEGANG